MTKKIKRESRRPSYIEWYKKQGFCVIPCKPKSKEAAVKWEEYQTRKPRVDEEAVWWTDSTSYNVAVICGKISDNLAVVDIDNDTKKGKILHRLFGGDIEDKTLVVKTARGFHVYVLLDYTINGFKLSGEDVAIDVKGEGGYVLAPPSIHPSGAEYEPKLWLPEHKIMKWHGDLKQDLIELLKEKFDVSILKEEVNINDLLLGVEEGKRNNTAIIIASYYRRRELKKEEAWEQLKLWNAKNKSPLETEELKSTLDSAYDREQPYNYKFVKGMMEKELFGKQDIMKAEELLKQENILEWIEKQAFQDIIGHRKQKISLFLLNLVDESVHVQGDTSTGKSYMADRVFDCFPKHTWFKITGVTDKAIRYLDEDIKHLYLAEWKAVGVREGEESTAQFDIKLVISEGKLKILVVEKDETGRFKTRIIETFISNIISTTTDTQLPSELQNRVWEETTDKTLTPEIVKKKGEETSKLPSERIWNPAEEARKIVRCAIESLKDAPKQYVIPYFNELLKIFERLWTNPRAARDVEKLERLIYASALIHSKNRPIVDDKGTSVLVCVPQDFLYAWDYGDEAIIGTFTGETQRYREMKDKVKKIAAHDKPITRENLAKIVGVCSVDTAGRWLKRMEDDKVVVLKTREKAGKKIYEYTEKENTVEVVLSVKRMEELTEKFLETQKRTQKGTSTKSGQEIVTVRIPVQFCVSVEDLPDAEKSIDDEMEKRVAEQLKGREWEQQ